MPGRCTSKKIGIPDRFSPSVWLNNPSPGVPCEEGWGCFLISNLTNFLCAFLHSALHAIGQGRQLFLVERSLEPIISTVPLQLIYSCRRLSIWSAASTPLPDTPGTVSSSAPGLSAYWQRVSHIYYLRVLQKCPCHCILYQLQLPNTVQG